MLLLRLCYYLYSWRSKTSISTHYSLKPETAPACCSMYISLIIFLLRNFVKNKIIKSCNGVKRVKSKEGPHHIQMTISNCRRKVNWSKVAQKNFRIHFISLYSKDMTSIVTCKIFFVFLCFMVPIHFVHDLTLIA